MDRSNTLSESKDAKGYFERGNNFLSKGDIMQAIGDFDKAIHLGLQFAEAYAGRVITTVKLEKYTKAVEDFNKAIELIRKMQRSGTVRDLPKSALNNTKKQLRSLTKL